MRNIKQIKFGLLIALLMFSIASLAAKDEKPQNLCKGMLFFNGQVVKNKETKQKEPSGQGELFIKQTYETNNVSIKGNFVGDKVYDAVFSINEEKAFDFKSC